jgi:hypothetical protein
MQLMQPDFYILHTSYCTPLFVDVSASNFCCSSDPVLRHCPGLFEQTIHVTVLFSSVQIPCVRSIGTSLRLCLRLGLHHGAHHLLRADQVARMSGNPKV